MNDHTKFFVVKSILLNNRLKAYDAYLNEAINQGYMVEPLGSFYQHYEENEKHFILRHDVDHRGKATRKMFECEKRRGVKSTYFFRKSTVDKPLIDEMIEMIQEGFEVGFHFETLPGYIEETSINNKADIDLEECRNRLEKEIKEFEEIIGHKIQSICSHGTAVNAKLGFSNNAILKDGIPSNWNIDYEAYDEKMYEHVDCHIMDGSVLRNYGFSYRDTPTSAIKEEKNNIIFLAHPSHWWKNMMERAKLIVLFMLGKTSYSTTRVFKRIAQ